MPDIRLEGIKVVAVDDNADARELLKIVLERSSAETVVVSSGQEALEAIRDLHPDVLICDLAMPKWTATKSWRTSGGLNQNSDSCR